VIAPKKDDGDRRAPRRRRNAPRPAHEGALLQRDLSRAARRGANLLKRLCRSLPCVAKTYFHNPSRKPTNKSPPPGGHNNSRFLSAQKKILSRSLRPFACSAFSALKILSFFFLLSLFSSPSPAFASCFNPAGNAGNVIYNGGYGVVQYCNGGAWIGIGRVANLTGGLIHWWKLDEAPGATTAADSVGGTTLSKTGTVDFTASGMVNGALYLPNDSTVKNFSAASPADIAGVSTLTESMWFRRAASSSVVQIGGRNTGSQYTGLEVWSDGKVWFEPSNNTAYTYGTVANNDTNWHLATMVFDGTQTGNAGRLKGYIDGVAQTLTFAGTIPATLGTSSTFYIGGIGGSGNDAGNIDDARIYNRALSAADVRMLYTSTGGMSGDINSNLFGWWKFDDGSGTSAADSSVNGDTGTLFGTPTWTTGQFNGALSFNAADPDRVKPLIDSYFGSGSFTFAAWIKPTPSALIARIMGGSLPLMAMCGSVQTPAARLLLNSTPAATIRTSSPTLMLTMVCGIMSQRSSIEPRTLFPCTWMAPPA
jgi:hypothetical protein